MLTPPMALVDSNLLPTEGASSLSVNFEPPGGCGYHWTVVTVAAAKGLPTAGVCRPLSRGMLMEATCDTIDNHGCEFVLSVGHAIFSPQMASGGEENDSG